MDERDRRRIGEQLEPGGREKAPGRLELLQRFINTYNHDFPTDWDRIGSGEKAAAWLCEKGLIEPEAGVSDDEAVRLRALREALRALVVANHTGGAPDPAAVRVLRAEAAALRVTVDDGGRTALAPARPGVDGAADALLAILHEAQATGVWARMKGCRQCAYAFFDRSKNRSAAWCAMAICGNRTKNRAYYRRRRSAS